MSDALILFVEKAYKLETSPFWQWLRNRRGPSDIERILAGDWLAHDGLSPEAFDSFCLTLRLLIQDQDGFSIRRVLAIAEAWPDLYAQRLNAIRLAIEKLRLELRKRSLIQFIEGRETTNGDVFDIIFYGGIAHANPGKRDNFRRLTSAGLFSYFVFQAFTSVLFHYRNCIQTVAFHLAKHLEESRSDANAG